MEITRADSTYRQQFAQLANAHHILSIAWSWGVVPTADTVAVGNVEDPSCVFSFPAWVRPSYAVSTHLRAEQLVQRDAGNPKEQLLCQCLYRWLRERSLDCTCGLSASKDSNRWRTSGLQHPTTQRADGTAAGFLKRIQLESQSSQRPAR